MRRHQAIEIDVHDGVAVKHEEPFGQMIERRQDGAGRTAAFGFGKAIDRQAPGRAVAAIGRDRVGADTRQDGHVAQPGRGDHDKLAAEERRTADIDERLGIVAGHRFEAAAAAAGENDDLAHRKPRSSASSKTASWTASAEERPGRQPNRSSFSME